MLKVASFLKYRQVINNAMLKTKKTKKVLLIKPAANIPKIKLAAIAGRINIILLFCIVNYFVNKGRC